MSRKWVVEFVSQSFSEDGDESTEHILIDVIADSEDAAISNARKQVALSEVVFKGVTEV